MDTGKTHEQNSSGFSKPRSIPTPRNKADRKGPANSSFAKSAPVPRAPVINSLRAHSVLDRNIPPLELPPQCPDGRSVGVSAVYAQSAPSDYLLSIKKPILHALQFRERVNSGNFDATRSRIKSLPSSSYSDRYPRMHSSGAIPEATIEEDQCTDSMKHSAAEENLESMRVFSTIKSMSLTEEWASPSFIPTGAVAKDDDVSNKNSNSVTTCMSNNNTETSENIISDKTVILTPDSELSAGLSINKMSHSDENTKNSPTNQQGMVYDDECVSDEFEEQFDMDYGA